MQRIKYEEIQNSIQNYIKQRNLSHPACLNNEPPEARELKSNSSARQLHLKKQLSTMEASLSALSLTSLNDLVLIESSISDYYALSFVPASEQDYLKQFQAIRRFIEAQHDSQIERLLHPLFVHMCIDLTLAACPIQQIVE